MNKEKIIEEFIEKGADLEHERWSGWQKYLHSLCSKHTVNSLNASTKQYEEIETGGLVIHRDRVVHWERQIATPYSELTEKEKEYDRIEVRKYLPLVESALTSYTEELKKRIENELLPELKDVRLVNICKNILDSLEK